MITDKDVASIQQLTNRIHRTRLLLGDTESRPGYIVKKRGHRRDVFRTRIKTLKRLEAQRTRLILELASREAARSAP